MSVELDQPAEAPLDPAILAAGRAAAEIARGTSIDPRIPQLVPGFDAPFFQAGLAGYSDGPMRLVARRHGCPYCITEALLDRTLINGGKGRRKEDPDLLACECGTGDLEENRAAGLEDHPIAGQVMGTHPAEMADGARILCGMGYETIDVNLACPVKKIRRSNRGGHFLAHPEEAIAVLAAVRAAVPEGTPCSVKLRRSYDDTPEMARHFDRIIDAAFDLGYAWATVHARTVVQRYLGPSRWELLRAIVARRPGRLIFGSGDVWRAEDVFLMLEHTGVAAVAVARGCIGNPWIFRQARDLMAGLRPRRPTLEEQREVLLEHFRLAVVLHGETRASRLMRKFGIRFAAHHPAGDAVRQAFIRCGSVAEWRAVIAAHYPEADGAAVDSAGLSSQSRSSASTG
jgi:tRNA-dihydrouridine synthase B